MWCKVFVFIVGLVMSFTAQGQGTVFEWAKVESGGYNRGGTIQLDDVGNVYTIGVFEGTTDFDSGIGTFNLTSIGGDDIFITKIDALGNFVWAKAIGSLVDDYATFTVDVTGNIYMTGYYLDGTMDFDPNIGTFNLTSSGNGDIFVCKLNTLGDFVWAKKMGGSGYDDGSSIVVDPFGDICITGYFEGTVDFDPNIGIFNLTSVGGGVNFICKLDGSGSLIWAKNIANDGALAINVDLIGNIYMTGSYFSSAVDFDPGPGVANLNFIGGSDIFICKLDQFGSFVWAKSIGGIGNDLAGLIVVDIAGNFYISGSFEGIVDFDPNTGVANLTSINSHDLFVSKFDPSGSLVWAKSTRSSASFGISRICVDAVGSIYLTNIFNGTIDFDPSAGVANRTSISGYDIYINKLDVLGNFVWVEQITCIPYSRTFSIIVDTVGNIYTTGPFRGVADFDPSNGVANFSSTGSDNTFILKLRQQGVHGQVYQDFNQNCQINVTETGVPNQLLTINPGNIIIRTNSEGIFFMDSLPVGNYTITADTSSPNWQITCPTIQNFAVTNTSTTTVVPSFGFISTSPCPAPDIAIHAPFLRPGFSNQRVYIQACNDYLGTDFVDNAFVIVELDSLLTVQTSSMPYTTLGNNKYRINIDTLYPGQCTNFWLGCTLSTSAILNQTLCMTAKLYPVDSCALDAVPSPHPSTPLGKARPCNLPWDRSSLRIDAACVGDSVRFIIHNTGLNMDCFTPVRVYLDTQLVRLDTIKLVGGTSVTFMFAGNGQTWRLEADQHPLHPGNSQPNATIENCGTGTWTPNLVTALPLDDADPAIDIYCGLVSGSYDPNDKTGYPLGVGSSHNILPFQDMEYVIRFQNTGTDTAFTIVVRDTLSTDFNIFSVRSGVSSHDYSFKMYGPRVLEWTFNNIMLPDSNVNEAASHGFVKFKVHHAAGLTNGTVTENSAAIYFDFNPPIFTNTSWHTINDYLNIGNAISVVQAVRNSTKVYPNPTSGRITLQIEQTFTTANILITNTLGQVFLSSQTSDAVSDLTLPNAAGIYFIRVEMDGVVQTHKVVRE